MLAEKQREHLEKARSDLRTRVSRCVALLRQCAICARGLRPVDPLCEDCWRLHFGLQQERSFVFPEGADLQTTMALMAWPVGDLTTARLLLNLKGGDFESGFLKLATEFIRILNQRQFLNRYHPDDLVLVPAPARSLGKPDHAARWAEALSQITGIPWKNLLKRDRLDRDQRFMRRRERSQVQLLLQPEAKVSSEKIYIFVDDVMTSGSTFRAGKEALKGGRAVWGWFIAYRT